MSKYTPGPWAVGDIEDTAITMRSPVGHVLYRGNPRFTRADARLIAAAPELLAELAHLVRLLEPLEQSGALDVPGLATLNGARAAIAKAEGK
jgi:hypothetical protein